METAIDKNLAPPSTSERSIDRDEAAAMERKKRDGYF